MEDEQKTVVLIDLSSILYPIWHMSQSEPDTNHTANATVAKVRALASGQPHVAVCCDSGKSFRAEIDPTYKATRGERDATLIHQLTLAQEILRGDGFPVWSQAGMEADDLIATATVEAVKRGMSVLVVSADKDLLQLVGPTVRTKSTRSGDEHDEAKVVEKFGVAPAQIRDYLTLVGDASDNIKGAVGIGAKKAAALLQKFGTLEAILAEAKKEPSEIKPSEVAALKEFSSRWETVRALVTLRYDADVPFDEVLAERVTKETAAFLAEAEAEGEDEMGETMEETEKTVQPDGTVTTQGILTPAEARERYVETGTLKSPPDLLSSVIAATPVEWERQLEPRTMVDAFKLAAHTHASRLFSGYGSPDAVLSTILAGRELGMPAMVSLRAFHIVEGQPRLSAEAIRARVITSGKAKFFRCTERTAQRATYETQRGDDPVRTLTYTIEEARAAWTKDDAKFAASGWGKNPSDMLVARSSSKLAREVYPDVTLGLIAAEEIDQ